MIYGVCNISGPSPSVFLEPCRRMQIQMSCLWLSTPQTAVLCILTSCELLMGLSRRAPKQYRPLWQLIISICHRWEPPEYAVSPKNWPGLLLIKVGSLTLIVGHLLVASQIKSRWQKDGEPTFCLLGLPSCPWVNSPWCLLLVSSQISE